MFKRKFLRRTMGNYVTITFKTRTRSDVKVKMEDQCSFENNGKIYRAEGNKISVFDKSTQTWTTATSGTIFGINDYQLQTLEAFANNHNETDVSGNIVLSKEDIRVAQQLFSERKFKDDVNSELNGNYETQKAWKFSVSNGIAAYISNGNPSESGNLIFGFGDKTNCEKLSTNAQDTFNSYIGNPSTHTRPTTPTTPVTPTHPTTPTAPVAPQPVNSNLFNNPNIIKQNSFTHTVARGEDIVSISQKYDIDTYQIIAANPQLREGRDYNVTYTNGWPLTNITSHLRTGTEITIPARYSVRPGCARSIEEVAQITNISFDYLNDLLTVTEVKASHPGKPDTTAYPDGGWIFYDAQGNQLNRNGAWAPPRGTTPARAEGKGIATIGYGHAGGIDGNNLVLPRWNATTQHFEGGTTINEQQARDLLCNDILKHQAMADAYFGRSYSEAPVSVRSAIFDVVYNKGIWNGFMHPKKNERTKLVKQNLQDKHYASALVNTRWLGTNATELKRRNVYRFISGLRDLPEDKRKSAMDAYEAYYKSVLDIQTGLDKTYMQRAWNNARNGTVTNFRMKAAQHDRP